MSPLMGSMGPLGRTRVPTDDPRIVTRVRAYPRASWASRLTGQQVWGSNDVSFPTSGGTLLATLGTATAGVWTDLTFTNTTYYKWIWLHNPGSYTDVAEIEFYGSAGIITPTTTVSSTPYNNDAANNKDKAFDGNFSTFFTPSVFAGTPYTEYIGISIV